MTWTHRCAGWYQHDTLGAVRKLRGYGTRQLQWWWYRPDDTRATAIGPFDTANEAREFADEELES